jgi:hypothetical protein
LAVIVELACPCGGGGTVWPGDVVVGDEVGVVGGVVVIPDWGVVDVPAGVVGPGVGVTQAPVDMKGRLRTAEGFAGWAGVSCFSSASQVRTA